MGRKLSEVLAALPEERQQHIEALARVKAQEMLAAAKTLADIRKAAGKTQVEVAKTLGVKQNAISQLEQRSDTYLSTFRKFLKGMGMQLELAVVTSDGARVNLAAFQPWDGGPKAAATAPFPAVVKAAARSAGAAPAARKRVLVVKSGPVVAGKKSTQAKPKRAPKGIKILSVSA